MSHPNDGGDTPDPIFHFGCGSLLIAAILGYPLGMIITRSLWGYDAGPFGALLGGLPILLLCGFIARQRQKGRRFGIALLHGRVGVPSALRDWVVWSCALIVAVAMAFYGADFAVEIGEPATAGAFGLGIIGLVVGLLLGLIIRFVLRMTGARG